MVLPVISGQVIAGTILGPSTQRRMAIHSGRDMCRCSTSGLNLDNAVTTFVVHEDPT